MYFARAIFYSHMVYKLSKIVYEQCTSEVIKYREPLQFPASSEPKFDLKIATALWDLGGAVASGHCRNGIPMPPPMTNYMILKGGEVHDIYGNARDLHTGYIFWNASMNWACIVFSGTYYPTQWRNNMRTNQTAIDFIKHEIPYQRTNSNHTIYPPDAPSLIHNGFYDYYTSVRDQIHDWINGDGRNYPNIIVTGRSLGGAISTICAYDISYYLELTVVHYSFASPRVGNPVFTNRFNKMVPFSIRVHNNSDYVCDLPFSVFGKEIYQHVGTPLTNYGFTINTGSIVKNHIDAYSDLKF